MYDSFFAHQIKRRPCQRRPRNPKPLSHPPPAVYSSRLLAAKLTMPSFDLLSRSKSKCVSYSKECKRRLLSTFKGRLSKSDLASKDCPILNLHFDALNCIMDFLPPASQMALLHSCKALYYSLEGRVARTRQSSTLLDYRQYLLLLCRCCLNCYACWDCNDIHEFKVTSKPDKRVISCPKQRNDLVQGSSLRDAHKFSLGKIQSLCKLSRMDPEILPKMYRQFLADASTTATSQYYVSSYWGTQSYPVKLRTTARVVGGKLYLKRVWVARYGFRRHRRLHDVFGSIQVCPHYNTSTSIGPSCPMERYQEPELSLSIQETLLYADESQNLSCLLCPTDITTNSHRMIRAAVLVSWQCLGGESVESPSFWERHSWTDRIPHSRGQDERDWHRGTSYFTYENGITDPSQWTSNKSRRRSLISRCTSR